jgi:hypothetical protein
MVKEILQKTIDGKLTADLFTAEAATPILNNSPQAAQFLKTLGTLNNIELLERREQSEVRIYRYRLTYSSGKLIYTVGLTKDDKIAGMQLRPE